MFADIRDKEIKFLDFHSQAARDLLSQLLVKDPDYRLQDPEAIMAHPFYAGIDWEGLMQRKTATPYIP